MAPDAAAGTELIELKSIANSSIGKRRTVTLKKEQSLQQAIALEEANLANLEQKRLESHKRLAALKSELAAIQLSVPLQRGDGGEDCALRSLVASICRKTDRHGTARVSRPNIFLGCS
jgi:hypothetical protein